MHKFDIFEIRDCLIMKDYHVYRFRQNLRQKRNQASIVFSLGGRQSTSLLQHTSM